MKNWTEIYNKYKDTELMEKVEKYFISIWRNGRYEKDPIDRWNLSGLNIQDVYGYLFCFAKSEYDYDIEKTIIGSFNVGTPKKLMLYRTRKFFESEFEEVKL